MPELKPHSWAQSGSPTSTILNRIREHNIEFGGAPARVAHSFDVPLYEIPADLVLVPRDLVMRAIALAEDAMGVDFSEHDAIHDELRTLIHP
ncbi:hypothetical protein [Pseudomonas citronellolis]|uniref:hypothetical protein n=1 Tax=Pseudomonas citronellolis TaxID=53408 RepID=UPI002FDA59D5